MSEDIALATAYERKKEDWEEIGSGAVSLEFIKVCSFNSTQSNTLISIQFVNFFLG